MLKEAILKSLLYFILPVNQCSWPVEVLASLLRSGCHRCHLQRWECCANYTNMCHFINPATCCYRLVVFYEIALMPRQNALPWTKSHEANATGRRLIGCPGMNDSGFSYRGVTTKVTVTVLPHLVLLSSPLPTSYCTMCMHFERLPRRCWQQCQIRMWRVHMRRKRCF